MIIIIINITWISISCSKTAAILPGVQQQNIENKLKEIVIEVRKVTMHP